jgi:hypothetical protein
MGFGIEAHQAKIVRTYEAAEKLFRDTPKPRGYMWRDTQRPLDDNRKHHMRVEQGESYYDAVLYKTSMARYYKPEIIDGKEVREVWHNVHGSQSSSTFQWYVCGFGPNDYQKADTENRSRLIGMSPYDRQASVMFPVRLRFVDGLLDVSKSRDCPVQLGNTTSDQRKADRKAFKKWLRPFEAMSKLEALGAHYMDARQVKQAFITNELFDPTNLACYIKVNGTQKVVDAIYPLGDVEHFNPSFKELV